MGLRYLKCKVGDIYINQRTVEGRRLLLRPGTSTLEQPYRI